MADFMELIRVMSNADDKNQTLLTELFPRGLSLECTEGDQESDLIEFTFDGRIWTSIIDRIDYPGGEHKGSPIPLYHSHVLWSYALCEQRQLDGSFELSLRSCGPHIYGGNVADRFSPYNQPDGVNPPHLQTATGTFVDANGQEKETIEFAQAAAGHYMATKRFTRDELAARAGSDGNTICILIRFVVARSYFTLSKLLMERITVSRKTAGMVERILRGEKTAGCDLAITVPSRVGLDGGDSGLPLTYYVHSAAFCEISDNFKKACSTGRSIDDLIVMNGQNACTIPSLAPDDMPVLIALAYGINVPLPTNIDRFGMLGRALMYLLNWDVVQGMFPHWERAICQQALALDKRSLASFAVLPPLLLLVWSAPYGSLPVAKRVAIGVFADMVWLHMPPGVQAADFMNSLGLAALGDGLNYINGMSKVIQSMLMHIEVVSAVRKIGLSMKKKHDNQKKEEKEVNDDVVEGAVISETTSRAMQSDLDAPTVVPIDDDEAEEPPIESVKSQCTIS